MCWVCPQHADDRIVRETSDESLTSHSPRQDVGTRRKAKLHLATDSVGPV
jgi:hypothetical protein